MKLVGNTGGIWFRRYGGGLVHSDYFEWSMKLANANRVWISHSSDVTKAQEACNSFRIYIQVVRAHVIATAIVTKAQYSTDI